MSPGETDLYKGLLQDEALMASMIQGLMDIIVIIDRGAAVRFINRAGVELLDYPESELIGKPIGTIVCDEGFQLFEAIRGLMTTGESRQCVLHLMTRSGEKIPATFNGSVLRNPDRQIHAVVGVIRDMRDMWHMVEELAEAKSGLEEQVKVRTAELSRAYENLKRTEGQLVQAEKLSSLGQLAAGVAHEINNPVGFVKSNLGRLNEYLEDILPFVTGYASLLSAIEKKDETAAASMARLGREKWEGLPVDFLLEDIKTIVEESCEGLTRVEGIVQNLKEFSHVDQAEQKRFNLNHGLESTLKIVWNDLKYKAEVIKELGEIPEILCHPQQLNQVFMNLLVNAGHAISQRAESSVGKGEAPTGLAGGGGTVAPPTVTKGKIWVRTYPRDGHIGVEVEDSGSGIAPEDLKNIFDPFFTTKPVGEGTGLGLSISYGIIENHKGKIEVESEVGQGTKFTIFLPVGGKQAEDGR